MKLLTRFFIRRMKSMNSKVPESKRDSMANFLRYWREKFGHQRAREVVDAWGFLQEWIDCLVLCTPGSET